eukprot:14166169-Ditylum_brightwellii.AAC.1
MMAPIHPVSKDISEVGLYYNGAAALNNIALNNIRPLSPPYPNILHYEYRISATSLPPQYLIDCKVDSVCQVSMYNWQKKWVPAVGVGTAILNIDSHNIKVPECLYVL